MKVRRENYAIEQERLFWSYCLYHICLLVMDFHFDMMLYSNLGSGNYDVGRINCACDPHFAYRLPTSDLGYSSMQPLIT